MEIKWKGYKYSPTTGNLYRNHPVPGSTKFGVCLRTDAKGYRIVGIKGKQMRIHRAVFEIMLRRSVLPSLQVDHIDGNKLNNSWSNLREVTPRQNSQNLEIHRNGRLQGTCFVNGKGWRSGIKIGNRSKFLGMFETEYLAHLEYVKASKVLKPF